MSTYESALDDAEKVVAHTYDEYLTHMIVWKGGVTFNCYEISEGDIREFDAFSLSDENGEPVNREKAQDAMQDRLDDITEF